MECHACNATNADTNRFCESCGSALASSCAACGARAAPHAKYCGACGAPLSPPATPAETETDADAAAPAGWGELKQATVLFVTHNLDEAITLSDRIVVLSARPGRVRAVIPVDLPRPRNVIALRSNPHYGELYQQLWELLQADIAAAPGVLA
jgi:hypothetical protein